MAVLESIDFDGATPPAEVTTANTPEIDTQTGSFKPLYNSASPSGGTFYSALVSASTGTSFNNASYTGTAEVYIEFYFKLNAVSTTNTAVVSWINSATQVGDLRFVAGLAQIAIRDNFTTRATSTTFALGTWHRAVVHCNANNATGHSLKLFFGANIDGGTADYDSGNLTATGAAQTQTTKFRFGLFTSGNIANYNIHRIRVQTTAPTGGGGGGSSLLPLSLDFDGTGSGDNGEDITLANTPELFFQSGQAPVFSTIIPDNYTAAPYSALVDATTTSYNDMNFSNAETTVWMGFYFRFHLGVPAASTWIQWTDSANVKVGELRMNTSTQIFIRDNITTVGTSTDPITLNTWHRAAVKCVPNTATGHRLKLYLGANRHGTVANYDSGDQAATSAGLTNVQRFRFGVTVASTEAHYRIARIRIDTTEPDGLTVTATDTRHASADIWKTQALKYASGGVWT